MLPIYTNRARVFMFLSAKSKGFFIDAGDQLLTLARTSSATAPFVVEDIVECAVGDEPAFAEALKKLQPKKSPSGYLHATYGFYASRRVVRRVSMDMKRAKEPSYLNEVAQQQLRIEPDQHTLAVLNANDGIDFDPARPAQKEVIFCGLPIEDISAKQDELLASGVFPERLEIGSLATVGALADYLAFAKVKTPTLMLEIGSDATHSYIVAAGGLETTRQIPQGLDGMIPVVQKELGLKDEESAKKLFYSNTFDFTGMGSVLIKKLIKELQSSIGFYEVQTGQSIGQVICTVLPPKLSWLEGAIASQLGVAVLKPDLAGWLHSRQITLSDAVAASSNESRRLGLFGLMASFTSHAALPEKAH